MAVSRSFVKCHNGWRQVRGTYHFTSRLLVLFLISSHAILFFNSISLTTCEWRGKVRSKNGLDMTAEVHVSNLHVKQLLISCRFHSGLSHYISNLNQHILVFQSYFLFIFISKTIIYLCFFIFQNFFFSLTSDATHYVTCDQEPITWSLQTNCTLESTLSHIFLFFELRHVGGSLISCKNTLMFA